MTDMKKISVSLKITIIAAAVFGAALYFWAIPFLGRYTVRMALEFSYAYYPWLILLWITAVPCYIALVLAWRVVRSIDKDELFKAANARRFGIISKLAFGDALFFLTGNVVYMFLNMSHPSIALAAIFICIVGVAFGICMSALAGFFEKAESLQEENDLTI